MRWVHWRRRRPRLISEPCWQHASCRSVTPRCRRAVSCGRTRRRPGMPGHTATTTKARRIARRCTYSRSADDMLERYPGAGPVTAPPRGINAPPSGSFPVRPRAGSGLLCTRKIKRVPDAVGHRPFTGVIDAQTARGSFTRISAHRSRYSSVKPSGSQAFSRERNSTRRILPEIVLGSSMNSMRRMR
jgi:hypothetical protein